MDQTKSVRYVPVGKVLTLNILLDWSSQDACKPLAQRLLDLKLPLGTLIICIGLFEGKVGRCCSVSKYQSYLQIGHPLKTSNSRVGQ